MSKSGKKDRHISSIKGAKATQFLLTQQSPFLVQEAYYALRTNIAFSLPGNGTRCIGVTSSNLSEGKSTNAINVALSFAEIGKRVLLIDCDMRLPTVASKLGIEGKLGLSNLLVGESTIEDAVQRIDALNVDVLPAGKLPPDPTRLLESEQIGILLAQFKKVYDYIITDLPPVTEVADAAILSKYIDGFLLVVRHNRSKYRAISDMLYQLNFVNAKIIGFVYHDTQLEKRKYNHHYYGTTKA